MFLQICYDFLVKTLFYNGVIGLKNKIKFSGFVAVLLILSLLLPACGVQAQEYIAPTVDFVKPNVRRVVLTESSNVMTAGTQSKTITAPYVKEGRMLVPLRAVSEGLGAIVNWDEAKQQATIAQNGKTVYVTIGSAQASDSDGNTYTLDVPAELYNGNTTMVPIRFVSEALGYEVTYDDVKQSAYIAMRGFADAPVEISQANLSGMAQLVKDKTRQSSTSVGAFFADNTDANGKYKQTKANWTSGYLVSQNLVCYELSGDSYYLNEARNIYDRLLATIYVGDKVKPVFNLGITSAMRYFEKYLCQTNAETGEKDLTPLLDAANALAGRQAEAGYLHPWGDPSKPKNVDNYRMLIDSMCSLGLFVEAAKMTGDASYMERAKRHADLTMQVLVREDYTTCHTYIFNTYGQPAYEQNRQGYKNGSCWARGISWGISGMSELYFDTGDVRYLECAKRLIDTYLLKCEPDMIARWDLDFTGNTAEPFDTSASAITAYGMLNVYKATNDSFYLECAKRILNTLYENYSSKDDSAYDAVLKHGVANKPGKTGVDVGLIYGDYFFALTLRDYINLTK